MKKFHPAVLGLAAGAAVAFAATGADANGRRSIKDDVPPPFSWTGFYVGLNAGYAWGDADASTDFTCPAGAGCPVSVPANLANIRNGMSGSVSADGFTGGIQAGYNLQSGSTVFGVELDFNAFNLEGSRSASIPSTTTTSIFNPSASGDTDWLFTLRGRLGWTLTPTTLLYATGGLAVTEARVSNAYTTTNNPANTSAGASSRSETLTGWVLGGGVEWAVSRNWTVKGEYLYVDFGSLSTTATLPGAGFANPNVYSTTVDLTAHIARLGINYKF